RALFFCEDQTKRVFFVMKNIIAKIFFFPQKKKSSKTFFVQKKILKKFFIRNNDKIFVLLSDKKGIHCLFFFKALTRIPKIFINKSQKTLFDDYCLFFLEWQLSYFALMWFFGNVVAT
ncbi:hypothetical protein RFI_32105, partial [Reticulomyxa filosa]